MAPGDVVADVARVVGDDDARRQLDALDATCEIEDAHAVVDPFVDHDRDPGRVSVDHRPFDVVVLLDQPAQNGVGLRGVDEREAHEIATPVGDDQDPTIQPRDREDAKRRREQSGQRAIAVEDACLGRRPHQLRHGGPRAIRAPAVSRAILAHNAPGSAHRVISPLARTSSPSTMLAWPPGFHDSPTRRPSGCSVTPS